MNVLVTGAGGQLARDLVPRLRAAGHAVTAADRRTLDVTRADAVAAAVDGVDWVVNCAAYTQVDQAEADTETAFAVNRDAPGALARAASQAGARILHVSTDYVFDGTRGRPYAETDEPAPLNVYGRSKLEGERAVLDAAPQAVIVRTAWVYGVHGHNFVRTILRYAAERERLTIVDDQIGSPTWTGDLADALVELIDAGASGTFHFTNEGVASWYDLGRAIVEEAPALGFPIAAREVAPVPSEAFPRPAPRPACSLLDKRRVREQLGRPIPYWRDALRAMLTELQRCGES